MAVWYSSIEKGHSMHSVPYLRNKNFLSLENSKYFDVPTARKVRLTKKIPNK